MKPTFPVKSGGYSVSKPNRKNSCHKGDTTVRQLSVITDFSIGEKIFPEKVILLVDN
jgi:hypothetical protein